jgi:hypothetical protein
MQVKTSARNLDRAINLFLQSAYTLRQIEFLIREHNRRSKGSRRLQPHAQVYSGFITRDV